MSEEPLRIVEFAPTDRLLREDVNMLGALVGDILAEQRSPEFLAEVERLRRTAIRRRETDAPVSALADALHGVELDHANDLVRAFATYFQAVNLAERVHRIRRRRDYEREDASPQPGGLRDVIDGLAKDGVSGDELAALLPRLHVEPVFTAHPTEAVRRALLKKEREIVASLVDDIDRTRTPNERRADRERIRLALTTSWQTAEAPPAKPSVEDEFRHVGYYLSDVLYRVLPVFFEVFEDALRQRFDTIDVPDVLAFGSWVGGDMDGNPNVGADTIAATLAGQRALVLAAYRRDLVALGAALSQSLSRVGVSPELLARIDDYKARIPNAAAKLRPRHADMPYRNLLSLMHERLWATTHDEPEGYADAAEFQSDIALIEDSLQRNRGEHAGGFAVRRVRRRAACFGFHLASLDLRQDSATHDAALAALLDDADWPTRSVAERTGRLHDLLRGERVTDRAGNATSRHALDVFKAVVTLRKRYGERAFGPYIISMSRSAADALSVLALARMAGCTAQTAHGEPVLRQAQDERILRQAQDERGIGQAHQTAHGELVEPRQVQDERVIGQAQDERNGSRNPWTAHGELVEPRQAQVLRQAQDERVIGQAQDERNGSRNPWTAHGELVEPRQAQVLRQAQDEREFNSGGRQAQDEREFNSGGRQAQDELEFDSGGHVPLDIAPLFETVDDLDAAADTLRALFADPLYREHLAARGGRQVVMLGYSDSAKDGGLVASRWALQQTQIALMRLAQESGVRIAFFHGRGGSISRGGGKTGRAVIAAPRGSIDGYLRLTEQGEVIHRKYGIRALALRHLEQAAGAVLRATLRPRAPEPREDGWRAIAAELSRESRDHYRALVHDNADFPAYFRAATPIDVIERLRIGSRPSKRAGGEGVKREPGIASLRAIPWVFAWAQNRSGLTAWYGVGTALERALQRHGRDALSDMARDWPFFNTLVDDVEMVLAKSDPAIFERYSQLAGGLHARFHDGIAAEFERTRDAIFAIKDTRELLADDRRLRQSIRLRNPYIDPISMLQIDLLRRWREGGCEDEALLQSLIATVNGIAAGIQNTG